MAAREYHREEYRGWTLEVFRTTPHAGYLVGVGSNMAGSPAAVQCKAEFEYYDDVQAIAQAMAATLRRLVDERIAKEEAAA
jgi:hypothetical protein